VLGVAQIGYSGKLLRCKFISSCAEERERANELLVGDALTAVIRDSAGGVVTLTLNRPEKMNALNRELMGELRAHVQDIIADPTVTCVCLVGAGRCFSAGHDLSESGLSKDPPGRNANAEAIDLFEQIPVPTIAGIHGHCMTGGLELALAADIIIAADTALFSDTHTARSVAPIWGMSVRLPERIGRARALELGFTACRIDGRTAAEWGLANRCVVADQLLPTVHEMAGQISDNSRQANIALKRLHQDGARMTRRERLDHERVRPYPTH
jgi:enoyl-CoA hydratase/carnithine racemase